MRLLRAYRARQRSLVASAPAPAVGNRKSPAKGTGKSKRGGQLTQPAAEDPDDDTVDPNEVDPMTLVPLGPDECAKAPTIVKVVNKPNGIPYTMEESHVSCFHLALIFFVGLY